MACNKVYSNSDKHLRDLKHHSYITLYKIKTKGKKKKQKSHFSLQKGKTKMKISQMTDSTHTDVNILLHCFCLS